MPPAIAKVLEKVNPVDVALLSMGFFLGHNLHVRPGIEVPLPGQDPFYLGFPDFRAEIDVAQEEQEKFRVQIAALLEEIRELENRPDVTVDECRRRCREQYPDSYTDRVRCEHQCGPRGTETQLLAARESVRQLQEAMGPISRRLRNAKLGQGMEMAILAYAVTRPGFVAGVGQIVTGIGELVPG